MIARFGCEQCFTEYDDDKDFKVCGGDACHEEVCGDCCMKCKNPTCKRYVCDSCLQGRSKQYCGEYCIKCAIWRTEYDDTFEDVEGDGIMVCTDKDEKGDWYNYDYVAAGQTHDEGYKFLEGTEHERVQRKQPTDTNV